MSKSKIVYYTYKGTYRNKEGFIKTDKGQLYAQQTLAKELGAPKTYQVNIGIVERDGMPYYYSADY